MGPAEINSKVAEAIAANEAGDPATALTKLRSAHMMIAALPNATGPDGVSLQWDRAAVLSLIAQVQAQQGAAGGIRRTKISYRRTRSDDCD